MRACYARQIRCGLVFAREFALTGSVFLRRAMYEAFVRDASFLEWRAFERARLRLFVS